MFSEYSANSSEAGERSSRFCLIKFYRRETRRQTEKTNINLSYRKKPVYSTQSCIVLSQTDAYQKPGLSILLIAIGIGALAQGVIVLILFHAGAEVIRLLKKLNDLPFAGVISKTTSETNAISETREVISSVLNAIRRSRQTQPRVQSTELSSMS